MSSEDTTPPLPAATIAPQLDAHLRELRFIAGETRLDQRQYDVVRYSDSQSLACLAPSEQARLRAMVAHYEAVQALDTIRRRARRIAESSGSPNALTSTVGRRLLSACLDLETELNDLRRDALEAAGGAL